MKATYISIREAGYTDLPRLQGLLAQLHLSDTDLLVEGTRYWLAEDHSNSLVGVVGLEIGPTAVLLRSAGVSPVLHGQGIGTMLVEKAFNEARAGRYKYIYLFTGSYWQQHGFREVPVPELVAHLPEAPQVKQYERLGWLPTEIAWRRDLDGVREG